jgi:hypothetical protein
MEVALGLGVLAILGYACFELLKLLLGSWRDRRSHLTPPAPWPAARGSMEVGRTVHRSRGNRLASDDDLVEQFRGVMPRWPASDAVIEAAEELLRLQRDIGRALDAGLPANIGERLIAETALATEELWKRIERLLTVAAMLSESGVIAEVEDVPQAIRDELAAESGPLVRLAAASREARAGLAELVLNGVVGQADAVRALNRFRPLGDAVRELSRPGWETD